jgi:hypothetical protein
MAKYTQELVKEICNFLEEGLYQKDAARHAGISEDTFYTWINQKPEFSESIELSIARYKLRLIKSVNRTTVKDGKLALEVLARRWPHEYGQKEKTVPEQPVRKHTVKGTREDFKALAKYMPSLNQQIID